MKILAWILSIICFFICVPFISLLSVMVFKGFYSGLGIYNYIQYIVSVVIGFGASFQLSKELYNALYNKFGQ